ncbi:uncharacterized protein LOC135493903 [Lineus longissimus]|uniref:uncharacterized protein LOC135493903 n=1 Tax=Lineus longissimus TaxID=88925 RepID=UPI002B4EE4C5
MELIKLKISSFSKILGLDTPHAKFGCYLLLGVTATGATAQVMWYLIRRQIAKVREDSLKPVFDESETNGVDVETLGALCKSTNTNLRRCAEQLITERFVNNSHALNKLFHNCLHGNKDEIYKACSILCHGTLMTEAESWPLGFDKAVIHTMGMVLIHSIEPDFTDDDLYREKIQKMAAAGLFAASSLFGNVYSAKDQDDAILQAFLPEMCHCLLYLVRASRDRDVQRFCLIIINHLIIDGNKEEHVFEAGGVPVIASVFVAQQGDIVFQKMCLQLLIVFLRIRVVDDKTDPRKQIADQKVIWHLVACLRSDDLPCVNCAAAVLYQLVTLSRQEIVSVPGLVRVFGRNLASNDAKLQWLILRIIFMLAVEDAQFKLDVLNSNDILERLSALFMSGETEVVSSALALTDCILLEGKDAVMKVLNASDQLIPNLTTVISHREPLIQRMLAEILGLICTCEEAMLKAVDFGIVPAILHFAQITQQSTSDSDLVFHATAMLLNLAMTSDSIKCEILKAGGLSILMELAIELGNRTNISVLAAKSLIMLGYTDQDSNLRVECNKDRASVIIGKKRAVFLGSGLHVVTWHLSTNQIKHVMCLHNSSDLIQIKPSKEHGILYILVINGSKQLTEGLHKASFMFKPSGEEDVMAEVKNHTYSVLIGHYREDKFHIKDYQGSDLELMVAKFQISYNSLVNHFVSERVVQPAVKSISMSPVTSPVSKVSELEILQVLCHHEDHRNTVLNCEMMLNDLRDMVRVISECLHKIEQLEPIYFAHSLAALEVLVVLAIDARFCKFAVEKKFVPVLIDLLHSITRLWLNSAVKGLTEKQELLCTEYHEVLQNLAKHALLTLYQFINVNDIHLHDRIKLLLQKEGAVLMVWSLLLCAGSVLKASISVSASAVLLSLCCEDALPDHDRHLSLLNHHDKTSSLQLSPSQLWAKNDSWTFESVRATHGANFGADVEKENSPKGWYYEATIHSKGIIQIGWSSKDCNFSPQKGLGVGDDKRSVAFDGERCKKWNGPLTEQLDNVYGEPWKDGDTISCLMSDKGDVIYWLDGKDLGIAFTGLDPQYTWYPAASLATDQCVEFNFGATAFKHSLPEGYLAMKDVPVQGEELNQEKPQVDETYEELKDNLIPLSQQSKCFVPTLYFEVNLPLKQRQPLHMGMMYLDDPIREKLYISYCNNVLTLPDGRKIADFLDEHIPVTIGIGYLFHQSTIFFVVDGSPIKKTFSIPRMNKPLIPYLNCTVVDVNFGTKYFVYDPANDRTIRLSCAALLHDYFDLYCHTSSKSYSRALST